MIGKIITGKSFRGCLLYCLHDKRVDSAVKNRSEVLAYNKCYGNVSDLIKEFNDVRNLNMKLSKPVMHITLSAARGENLKSFQWSEIAEKCALDLGFEKNQFVAVLHKDTAHQHIHIIANRIGFDGRTVKDGNNFRKIANFCRKIEGDYNLKEVQNPRRFQDKKLRTMDRFDSRKEKLKIDISQSLKNSNSLSEFVYTMEALGYAVIKGRGIAFCDKQKVYTKGSDVGYSLAKIQTLVAMEPQRKLAFLEAQPSLKIIQPIQPQGPQNQQSYNLPGTPPSSINIENLLTTSAQPSAQFDNTSINKFKRKRRRKRQSL